MATKREQALALLDRLRITLERPGPVSLTDMERKYLQDVCDRALAGDSDPLQLGRAAGGQADSTRLMAEAQLVHRHIQGGATLRAACEAVGAALHRDGSKSGAVEKNYRAHRPALEAADRFYAARNAGATPDAADITAILTGKTKGK